MQGAVLSPLLFSAQLDAIRVPSPAALCKYADDLALCGPYFPLMKQRDFRMSRIATWFAEHGLLLNRSKYMECLPTFSPHAPSHANPSLSVGSSRLSSVTEFATLE